MKRNIKIRFWTPGSGSQPYKNLSFIGNQASAVIVIIIAQLIIPTADLKAQVVSLDSVFRAIDKNHPMLQEFDNRAQAMNAYTEGAKGWMAPMVGGGPFFYPYPGQTLMDERDKGMFVLSVEQDIPNPGKLNAKKNYFSSRAAVEEKGRAVQYNQLRAQAKENYYALLVLERKAKVLEENKKIVELMLKLARIRYPYNQGSLGNIYKAEARLYEVENMISMNQAEKEERMIQLKALMKLQGNPPMQIDTALLVDFNPNQLSNDTSQLITSRSDIQQLNRSIEVMYQNQLMQKTQAKPDFRIRYEHMQPRGDMPLQFSLMAMVSIPIVPWASKMYKSEVNGMNYEIEAMKKGKEAILIETKGMLSGMASQLVRMKQQLINYDAKIIPALKRNYETVMIAYEENRAELPIVIDAWEAMNMAQMEYLNKTDEYYKMIVRYEKETEK